MPERYAVFPAVLLAGLLAGCVGNHLPSVPDRHPASATAPQAPAYKDSEVLAMDLAVPDPIPPEMKGEEGMEHMRHDAEAEHGEEPSEKVGAKAYSCPMHPEVSADGPGRCHKCGMPLQKQMGGGR